MEKHCNNNSHVDNVHQLCYNYQFTFFKKKRITIYIGIVRFIIGRVCKD